jgi:predicted nucleic acid-binding Zn ribbon protein
MYSFECEECGHKADRYCSVTEYHATKEKQKCGVCEAKMRRVFSPIALQTDTRFFAGMGDGFGEDNFARSYARRKANAAGVSVTGKTFFPQLCRTGVHADPEAWCSEKSEIKEKLHRLGRGAEGSINVPVPERFEEKKPYRVADDLVLKEAAEVARKQQLTDLSPKEKRQLIAETRKRISPAGASVE